jgi:hypothetical protein
MEWDDPFARLRFSEAFHGAGAGAVIADLRFHTMGSGRA